MAKVKKDKKKKGGKKKVIKGTTEQLIKWVTELQKELNVLTDEKLRKN